MSHPTPASSHLSKTAALADKLVAASAKKSFDPFEEIDFDTIDGSAPYLPESHLPLHGTPLYAAMSEAERIEYSKHEIAALCGTGIWLENVLMRVLIDTLYSLPPTDPRHHYMLVEVADECRHSSMFGEFIRRAGTPGYRPSLWHRLLGTLMKSTYGHALGYIAILAAEELLDASNKATSGDKNLHPVARTMARIHIVEEARHMSFARAMLEEELPRLSRLSRFVVALMTPITVRVIAESVLNRNVYKALGIPGGYEAARNNPSFKARLAADLTHLTALLKKLGVMGRWTFPLWHGMRASTT